MEKLCDLHAHSVFSDGTLTPKELLAEADRIGLSALALTDHNTVAGLDNFLAEGKNFAVEAIAGVEFSTDYRGKELHLLGLFLPREAFPAVSKVLAEGVQAKDESNRALAKALADAGYPVDFEAMLKKSPQGHLNRAHFASEMTKLGYVPDIQTAFKTLLSPSYGLYQAPKRPEICWVISWLRSLGGVPVIAHPFLDLKEEEAVREFLAYTKPAGLVGMEVIHPKHSVAHRYQAQGLAEEFGLLPSGGSDFHGENKPDIQLGRGRGDLEIPMAWCQKLRGM